MTEVNDKFSYSLVKNEQGAFAVRSVVRSFDLDHVTDKDIVSFYKTFSQHASFDTGLLPLTGTGVLAIRSAGNHTQIVAQHAPGLYHINWGAYEGDSKATTYYLAQPYRVVIGDFDCGNLLGARMFYSPYPITSPDNILYHVNLPNVNCKGYRGNGVGWVCLYQNDDWSSLPFNEKVLRFIERCSGVETYNDNNMSETDGPRFYASYNKLEYLWDPAEWQDRSVRHGYEWTLDDQLWIPVQVKGIDDQQGHHENGQYLTLAMAMLGNYRAYYNDNNVPKLYNVVSRPDLELSSTQIADIFKRSFSLSPSIARHQTRDNPYQFTIESRQKTGSDVLLPIFNENESDSSFVCSCCEEAYSDHEPIPTAYNTLICELCAQENYCYIASTNKYYDTNDDSVCYSQEQECYYHITHDSVFVCENCSDAYGVSGVSPESSQKLNQHMYTNSKYGVICESCFYQFLPMDSDELVNCNFCSKPLINDQDYQPFDYHYKTSNWNVSTLSSAPMGTFDEEGNYTPAGNPDSFNVQDSYICHTCLPNFVLCPCGFLKQKEDVTAFPHQTTISDDSGDLYTVQQCCMSCIGNIHLVVQEDGSQELAADYVPISQSVFDQVINFKLYQQMHLPYVVNNKPINLFTEI